MEGSNVKPFGLGRIATGWCRSGVEFVAGSLGRGGILTSETGGTGNRGEEEE